MVSVDICERMIGESIRTSNAANLDAFQELEASATAKLLEINHIMTSVFEELDQKLVFNDQNATILKQQDVIKGILDLQEKSHAVEDEKLTRFAALGETLNETNKALHSQDQVIRAFMVGNEQELKGQFEECNKQLIGVFNRARVDFGATTTQQGGCSKATPIDRHEASSTSRTRRSTKCRNPCRRKCFENGNMIS